MEHVLDGNDLASATVPGPDIVVEPNITPVVDIPDVTAFSATPFFSTDVITPPINDDLFFEVYSSSLSKFPSNHALAFFGFYLCSPFYC
jgi:hypothetical protein